MKDLVSTETISKAAAIRTLGWPCKSGKGIWTKEKPDAILLTLWQQQISWLPLENGNMLYVDLEELLPEDDPEREKLMDRSRSQARKHHKRAERLERVYIERDLRLDVVILFGPVSNDKGCALPWHSDYIAEANNPWRVVRSGLGGTGLYRVETRLMNHRGSHDSH